MRSNTLLLLTREAGEVARGALLRRVTEGAHGPVEAIEVAAHVTEFD